MVALELTPSANAKQTPTQTTEGSQEEPTLSFSQLLKGLGTKVKDEKVTPLMLSANNIEVVSEEVPLTSSTEESSSSKMALLSALLNADGGKELPSFKNISPKELKKLIYDAKQYLKSKILQSEGYKKSSVKDMPKTLKTLTVLAKKFDINLSKITLEEVQPTKKKAIKQTPLLQVKNVTLQKVHIQKNDVKKDLHQVEKKQVSSLESALQLKKEPEVKSALVKDIPKLKQENIKLVKTEEPPKQEKSFKELDLKQEISIQKQIPKVEVQVQSEQKVQEKTESKIQIVQTPQKVEVTPLQEVQVTKVQTPQQTLQPKKTTHKKEETNSEKKVQHSKVESGFASLLKSSKVEPVDAMLKQNISNSSSMQNELFKSSEKSLESLLMNEPSENSTHAKGEVNSTQKAENFEVKMNEAKQMMKYLSQDVKTAIDDYKSPFTKIKVQLNPQQLGEVDLTVVKRGKNLHVNISSNTAAINTLAMNLNDLKMQLTSNGINNATFNFNSSSNSENAQTSGQQQQQQKEQAKHEYNYFTNEENNEEVLTSLEIVVPSYA